MYVTGPRSHSGIPNQVHMAFIITGQCIFRVERMRQKVVIYARDQLMSFNASVELARAHTDWSENVMGKVRLTAVWVLWQRPWRGLDSQGLMSGSWGDLVTSQG